MARKSILGLGLAVALVGATGVWSLYQRSTTEEVPYTVVATVDGVELRRYPSVILAETVAPSTNAAFRRLFRYISGANAGDAGISMTAPVEVDTGTEIPMTAPVEVGGGATLSMTAPVEREADDEGVRMAFYLPADYDLDTAPDPTDDDVTLTAVPERTLAVRRFTWRPTDARVEREREALLATLDEAGVPVAGSPFFMGYDAPWTLPFIRRNEVAVEVVSASAA